MARLKGARERKKANGGKGEGRWAYREDPERPEEPAGLAKMLALRAQRISYKQIAKVLNEQGIRSRDGKGWQPEVIRRVLMRGERGVKNKGQRRRNVKSDVGV